MTALSFADLLASTETDPLLLELVLEDEIRRGRVRAVQNGAVSYELTAAGAAELVPLLAGLAAIREAH